MDKNARFDHQSPTDPRRTPPCCAHDVHDRDNEPLPADKSAASKGCNLMDRLVSTSCQSTQKKD